MADRTVSVKLKADIARYVADLKRAGHETKSFGELVDSTGKHASVSLASLPAAAATASAGIATALGGAGAAFVGLGAVALRNNTDVRQSFEDLSTTINTGIAQDAAPLASAFVGAAEDIGAAYTRLRPELQDAFAASVPHVEALTASVIDFSENAMPGVVTAVESAGPVFEGLHELAAETGTAVSDFFSVISEHSEEAGQGIGHFGDLMQSTLPAAGSVLGDLTDLWAQHGDEVVDVVGRMTGVIEDISGSTLPVLGQAVGVAADAFSGLLDIIAPIADEIGPLIGIWLSLTAAMKGLRGVHRVLDTAAVSVANFGDTMGNARKGGIGGFRGAVRGVTGVLGGPFGLALTGATALLAVFGSQSRESAADQKALADALAESAGEFDANAKRTIFNSEAYQEVADSVGAAGVSQEDYLDAIVKGGPALESLRGKLKGIIEAGTTEKQLNYTTSRSYSAKAQAAKTLLGALGGLRGTVQGAIGDFQQEKEAVATAGEKMLGSVPGADALTKAMKTLSKQTATTESHVDALNTAWKQLFGIEITLQESIANWEAGLDTLAGSLKDVKEGTKNWKNALFKANGEIDLTTESGRKLMENLAAQGEDYRAVAQTAYDTAIKQGKSQQMATQAARQAVQKRRAQFIEEMTTLGFTQQKAQDLADEYLGMPEEVLTTIKAEDQATGVIAVVDGALAGLPERKTVTITGRYVQVGENFTANRLLSSTYADGGLVGRYAGGGQVQHFPGGGMIHGPGGPREDRVPIMASPGEFVVNAKATSEHEGLLRAINSGEFVGGPPRITRSASTAGGGMAAGDAGYTRGPVTIEGGVSVKAYSDRFSIGQVMDDLAMHAIR